MSGEEPSMKSTFKTPTEALTTLLGQALACGKFGSQDVLFQSVLFFLKTQMQVNLPHSWFENLEKFGSFLQCKFGNAVVEHLRGDGGAMNFGFQSLKTLQRKRHSTNPFNGIQLPSLYNFLNSEHEVVEKKEGCEIIDCIYSCDGMSIQEGISVDTTRGINFGYVKRALNADQLERRSACSEGDAFSSEMLTSGLTSIKRGIFSIVGFEGIGGTGKRPFANFLLENVQACQMCLNCLKFLLENQEAGDDEVPRDENGVFQGYQQAWVKRARSLCSNESPCTRCKENNVHCRKLKIVLIVSDAGGGQLAGLATVNRLASVPRPKPIPFAIPDILHVIKSIRNGILNRRLLLRGYLICLESIRQACLEREIPKLQAALTAEDKFDTNLALLVFSDLITETDVSMIMEKMCGIHSHKKTAAAVDRVSHDVVVVTDGNFIFTRSVHTLTEKLKRTQIIGDLNAVISVAIENGQLFLLEMNRLIIAELQDSTVTIKTSKNLPFMGKSLAKTRKHILILGEMGDIARYNSLGEFLELVPATIAAERIRYIKAIDNRVCMATESEIFLKNNYLNDETRVLKFDSNFDDIILTMSSLYVVAGEDLYELQHNEFVLVTDIKLHAGHLTPCFNSILLIGEAEIKVITNFRVFADTIGPVVTNLGKMEAETFTEALAAVKTASQLFRHFWEETNRMSCSPGSKRQGERGQFSQSILQCLEMLECSLESIIKLHPAGKMGGATTFSLEQMFGRIRYGCNNHPDTIRFAEKLSSIQHASGFKLPKSKMRETHYAEITYLERKRKRTCSTEQVAVLQRYAALNKQARTIGPTYFGKPLSGR